MTEKPPLDGAAPDAATARDASVSDSVFPEGSTSDSAALTALMRRALAQAPEVKDLDVLGGVQQRLRQRSGGKFYRDGWTTTPHPPVATYLVTALLMLTIVGVLYAVLVPMEGVPQPAVPLKPVQILPR